ncbi:MAG: phosphate ABC transporter substrate-binding protein [Flavobacteriia bacterium]|nr:phosphate ABC transporter substrate-binding protein [Flavobacteriia bacterium]
MKKQFLALLMIPVMTLVSCGEGSKEESEEKEKISITVKGSDTVLPLAQMEAEKLMEKDSSVSISVVGGGTGVGITALLEGTTDLAMASRDLKTEEALQFKGAKKEIVKTLIAYDALTVIVHPENKIGQLTREQIEKIYTGEITNWKEVGGEDLKIVAYSRESSSGTYEYFKEEVLDDKNYASNILSMPATGAIVQSVSQTKGAIGYIGLAYQSKSVKQLAISYDQGKTFISPSIETAKNKSYPISRPLFFMYDKVNEEKVQTIIEFTISEEGQKIVTEIGYIPLN